MSLMLNSDTLSQLKQFKQDLRLANNRFEGTVRATPGRFGFCQLDDGRDVYLNPDQMLRLLPGDRILIEVREDEKGRLIGDLIELLRSDIKQMVGSVVNKGPAWFINADFGSNQRWLFIPPKQRKNLTEGLLVVGKLSQHPFKDGKAQVEICQLLGKPDKPGIQTDYALHKHHINPKTKGGPDRQQLQTTLDEMLARRPGFHEVDFITIDAESTLDIDDALFCEANDNGWTLTVAIADPSAFFPASDALESQALTRGQSLYFPDRTIGMLPDNIATNFASLIANKPRLALLVRMQVSAQGAVLSSEILEAGITVKQRLTYESASDLLAESAESAQSLQQNLLTLQACASALYRNRQEEALVSPDRPDYRFVFDDQGQVTSIVLQASTPAHRIVEETMIAANRCAADFMVKNAPTGLYSTHLGFRPDRLEQIRTILKEQYPEVDTQSIEALEGFKALMRFLENQTGELPLRAIATRLLNRSALAETPRPHFGMGLAAYTTFTSPIRRYVDLIVHRNIKAILAGQKTNWLSNEALLQLQERLRVGRQAMNDAESWLKIRFAETLKGQSFIGHIVQTNGSGFVVKTDTHGIEGYVNLAQETEKFRFDGTYFQHIGPERQFRLEQSVEVVIQETDLANRQVLFSLFTP